MALRKVLFACLATSASAATIRKRAPSFDVLGGVNFPDPGIIDVDGTSYVFATSNGNGQVPVVHNANFANTGSWSSSVDALPAENIPSWASPNNNWAPDVIQLPDGSFVMYYSPTLARSSLHAVGVAVSQNVQGPYTDDSTEPFATAPAAGGVIDPAGFLDTDNRRYVVYKIDGPAVANGGCGYEDGRPNADNTSLILQEVDYNNGRTKIGDPVVIYNNQGASDSYNIEAPVIVKRDGTYFLFFSRGCFADNSYDTEYVTSTNILGPYNGRQTLIKTGDYGQYGPGSIDITADGSKLVYHSLFVNGDISKGRALDTGTLTFSGTTVTIN